MSPVMTKHVHAICEHYKDAGQPAHGGSLINIFVIHHLSNIIITAAYMKLPPVSLEELLVWG